ncbi:MAG: flavohemoglobin expression-modulating QEGLA motif protein [Nannocystaceae bacterium]|nr:flavohemoglobin expression-modulating QEGLA motif protein [bacterium]
MRVLEAIRWSPSVERQFFKNGASALPHPHYKPFDASATLAELKDVKRTLRGEHAPEAMLRKSSVLLETTARMLASVGSRRFSTYAQKLYGRPEDPFPATTVTPLQYARKIIRTLKLTASSMPEPPPPTLTAGEVARRIRRGVKEHFGRQAPEVVLDPSMAARAAAAPKRIRLRKGATFSDLDVHQLLQHEAFVHVATSLNGRAQKRFSLLAANHAGTTRTQEGLAVFAELMSGTLDPRRLLRLSHRVEATHLALGGANFLEVYRYFLDVSPNEHEAYQSTVRIFRGGTLEGGAPFTKDIVYLDGLCRVYVFLRAAVESGRLDCLGLLFAGKLDLEDIEALLELEHLGLCRPAKFVPPWVTDPRRLVAYFSVTEVIKRASTAGLQRHYAEQLSALPTLGDI